MDRQTTRTITLAGPHTVIIMTMTMIKQSNNQILTQPQYVMQYNYLYFTRLPEITSTFMIVNTSYTFEDKHFQITVSSYRALYSLQSNQNTLTSYK